MVALEPSVLERNLGPNPSRPLWIAFSGGCDSHVLLHLAAGAGWNPVAIHVDHGLHPHAQRWAEHCAAVCAELGVALTVRRVEVTTDGGGLEAAARRARYGVFEALLAEGGTLLLAHHQRDQAETLMLRLLRGAGRRGLAGMPRIRPLGQGVLARPLLDVPHARIRGYARAHGLSWIEDPSNTEVIADRNLIRNRVMPILAERWPRSEGVLADAAAQAREDAGLLDDLAAEDLIRCESANGLSASALTALSDPRRRNLVRYWLRRRGLRPPGGARLREGLRNLLDAAADANPELVWSEGALVRHRDVVECLPAWGRAEPPGEAIHWDLKRPLSLGALGELHAEPAAEGLNAALVGRDDVRVGFRAGGERIRLPGEPHRRTLKALFQEAGVPPWERARTPLVFVAGELAAVGERWVADGFAARTPQAALRLRWRVVNPPPF